MRCTYNVTLGGRGGGGVRVCVVAVEKQFVLHILSVCLLPSLSIMQCVCAMMSFVACPVLHYFSILFHKWRDFRKKKLLIIKYVFRFSLQYLSDTSIVRRSERDMIKMFIGLHIKNC